MIYDYIDKIAPYSTQMSFDNSGYMVGDKSRAVNNVMLCLDITNDIVRQAAEKKCQLIVSHHPVIFNPLRQVYANTPVYELISAGIDAVSAHTNYDEAQTGVSYRLAQAIGLIDIHRVDGMEAGVAGRLSSPLNARELAEKTKVALGCGAVSYTSRDVINTVAVVGGSGGDFAADWFGVCDAFVTGEAKHHHLLEAQRLGAAMIIAGHYETEIIAMRPLADMLAEHFPDTQFIMAQSEPPVKYL